MRVGDFRNHPDQGAWERIWSALGCPALDAKISPGDVLLATDLLAALASFRYLDWSDVRTRRAVMNLAVVAFRRVCQTRTAKKLMSSLERWEMEPMMELSELANARRARWLTEGDLPSANEMRLIGRAAVLSLDAKVTPDDLETFALTCIWDGSTDGSHQRAALLDVFPPLLTERWVNPWWEKRAT